MDLVAPVKSEDLAELDAWMVLVEPATASRDFKETPNHSHSIVAGGLLEMS